MRMRGYVRMQAPAQGRLLFPRLCSSALHCLGSGLAFYVCARELIARQNAALRLRRQMQPVNISRHLLAQTGAVRSGCLSLPGYSTIDKYPTRSPLLIADFIANEALARGGGVCEIGTRHGDLTRCLKHFVHNITAIELVVEYCNALRKAGISVLCQAIETVTPKLLASAQCDTYFWWAMNAATQSEKWLRHLVHAHATRGSTASVFIVYEDTEADLLSLRVTFPKYGGVHIHRVLFDEAGDQPWNANCTMSHDAGSYATGCFGRRGPWGVFHLAQFDIGPGTLTNDMAANVSHTEWRSRWLKAGRSSYGRLWH